MICFVYDGTFEGLLTSVYEAYYSTVKPEEITPNWEFQPNLLIEPIFIKTDMEKYNKVYNAIKDKISNKTLNLIYHVYLSELKGSSTLIYNYIKLGFKLGKSINLHLHNDIVLNIHKIDKKVTYECHRILGFVRFKEVKGMYYSPIEPDHNILALIAPHFASRLPNENWIIHDLKRNLAVLHNKVQWIITSFSKETTNKFLSDKDNELYESLWRDFFKAIVVENRINSKLQRKLMPVRYQKHLTEIER